MKPNLCLTTLALGFFAFCSSPVSAGATPAQPALTVDEEFLRIAEEVPGFGGLFYDREGVANVYLTDTKGASQFQARHGAARILKGEYNFRQLNSWKSELTTLMSSSELVFLDIDETVNRIRIGVDRTVASRAIPRLEGQLALARVPRAAILVEPVAPVHQVATLQDKVRPVPGGTQIAFDSFLCTLGFNVIRNNAAGFVTNSHCTTNQGGVDGTIYYQATNSSTNRIAVESADPFYFSGGACPAGRLCRYSDSSFATYDSASFQEVGRITRPANVGSLTISSTAPRFQLSGTASAPFSGQTLNKVGRTTGWSRGTVSGTCMTVNISNSVGTLLCQYRVDAAVQGGDSGSPVFSASTSDGDTSATLYGILWGCSGVPPACQTAPGSQFFMSSWGNITSELGALTVTPTVAATNAASFGAAYLAADSIVAAFGSNLATSTASASSTPLPTTLGGTTVRVRDSANTERLAGLLFVSPGQVNFVMPAGTINGITSIAVTNGSGSASTGVTQVTSVAPGLFAANANGMGVAAAQILRVKPDGTQIYESVAQLSGGQYVPAPISFGGDQLYLILYATGLRGRSSLGAVSVQVGSQFPTVLYAGPQGAFVGQDQVNLGPLPTSLAGSGVVNVRLTADGKASNTVTIQFQ